MDHSILEIWPDVSYLKQPIVIMNNGEDIEEKGGSTSASLLKTMVEKINNMGMKVGHQWAVSTPLQLNT